MRNSAKPQIDIVIRESKSSASAGLLPSFSALDKVCGEVSVSPPSPVFIRTLYVTLVGTVKTYVDRLSSAPHVSGSPDIKCTFLNIQRELLPNGCHLKPGQSYRFPFSFVLPERLPKWFCDHSSEDAVYEAHMLLPPSIGDDSGPEEDFFYPSNVSISYAVFATAELEEPPTFLERSHAICVRPTSLDHRSLHLPVNIKDYRLRDEATIRSFGSRKKGHLVMETHQPCLLHLPGPAFVAINLQYKPGSEQCQPPRLKDVKTKLAGMTFYSTNPQEAFPCKEDLHKDLSLALYSKSIPLSPWALSSGTWQKSFSPTGRCFYAMRLAVPITLPENIPLVPTFHSCYVSRVYRLQISIAISATSALTLKVPLQISNADAKPPAYSPSRQVTL